MTSAENFSYIEMVEFINRWIIGQVGVFKNILKFINHRILSIFDTKDEIIPSNSQHTHISSIGQYCIWISN